MEPVNGDELLGKIEWRAKVMDADRLRPVLLFPKPTMPGPVAKTEYHAAALFPLDDLASRVKTFSRAFLLTDAC